MDKAEANGGYEISVNKNHNLTSVSSIRRLHQSENHQIVWFQAIETITEKLLTLTPNADHHLYIFRYRTQSIFIRHLALHLTHKHTIFTGIECENDRTTVETNDCHAYGNVIKLS